MADDDFMRSTGGPSTFGGGAHLRRNAFDLSGVPGLNGPGGMVAGMLLQQLLPQILGPGYIAGPFQPAGQNLQMHRQSVQFFEQQQASMALGAKQDQETYYNMIRGVSQMHGVAFGAPQQAAARRISQDFSALSPFMAEMMPETWDRMHGFKGSAAVMARGMHEGGRMAFDPTTGRMGLSAESAGRTTQDISRQLYGVDADGVDRSMARMSGLRQGQTGQMFNEMMQRGLGPESMTPGSFSAGKTAKSLEEMSGAVKAVQEIFGDMGHPDAPMKQVFNALQQLTQGGAGQFSPEKLEQSVRTTYTIAKTTRLGIEGMQVLAGTLSQQADRLGVDRSLVPEAAQRAALHGHVFGASGALDAGGWRRESKEEFMQTSGQLSLQAAKSQQGQQLGAVMALSENNQLRAGTQAAKLAEAIRKGERTYDGGKSVFMSPEQFSRIMREGGASDAMIESFRHNEAATEEFVQKHRIGSLVRANMGMIDVDPEIARQFQSASFRTLATKGLTNEGAAKLGTAATRALRGMSQSDRADTGKRNAAMVRALREDPALREELRGVSDQELAQISGLGWAESETIARQRGFKGAHAWLDQTDDRMMARTRKAENEIAGIVEVQTSVRGLGQQKLLERITETLRTADDRTDIQDVIARSLGGVRKGDVTRQLADKYKALSAVGGKLKTSRESGASEEVLAEFREQARALVGDITGLEAEARLGGSSYGMSPAASRTPAEEADVRRREEEEDAAALARGGTSELFEVRKARMLRGGGSRPSDTPRTPRTPGRVAVGGWSDEALDSLPALGVFRRPPAASGRITPSRDATRPSTPRSDADRPGRMRPASERASRPAPDTGDARADAGPQRITGRLRIEWGGREGELDASGDPRSPSSVTA